MFGLMTLPAMAGELEQPMKKIGFNYKQAVKADDAATMEKYINEMKAQFDIAKQKNMPTAKKEKFLEGMNEVQTELDASLAALKAGDEAKAREHLAKVNDLKKEYHKYAKQKADPFHWDSLVRLTHWCGGHLYRQPLAQRGGRGVARAAGLPGHRPDQPAPGVGLVCQGPCPVASPHPKPGRFSPASGGAARAHATAPGHHGSGKLAVWTLWLLILATAGTGWFQNTEMGFELGADDWHVWCTWALQGMIALHLLAILFTSWRQRSNLVKRMLPRRRDKARALPQESDA